MYDANHGKTNLADMNVYLNEDHEFFSLQNMRMTPLEEYKSLQDVNVSFFKDDLRAKAEIGKYYTAASF